MSKSRKTNPYKKDVYQDGDRQHKMVIVKEKGKNQWKNHIWEDEPGKEDEDDSIFFPKSTDDKE